MNEDILVKVEKVLPLAEYQDYYVPLLRSRSQQFKKTSGITKRQLPKIDAMLEWGVVKPGDMISARGRSDEAEVQKNGNGMVASEEMSLQKWLKKVFGWSSVQTYKFAVHKESGNCLVISEKSILKSRPPEA